MAEPSQSCSLVKYPSAFDALNAEKQLLESVAVGEADNACFAWSTNQCLIVPKKFSWLPLFPVASKVLASDGWPVYVRQTGGGVTPQGPGIINTAIAMANPTGASLSILDSYRLICDPILQELNQAEVNGYCSSVPSSFCDGDFNVVVNGKKLAGTAQRWTRRKSQSREQVVFAHALILFKMNIEEAVDVVNRFYELIQLDEHFDAEVHCNYVDLFSDEHVISSEERLSERLLYRYQQLLDSTSGSGVDSIAPGINRLRSKALAAF